MDNKAKLYYERTRNVKAHNNVEKFISFNIEPGKAIDLGCGAGRDTIELLKNNWEVTSIDRENTKGIIEEQLNENELKNFKFMQSDFEELQLEKNNLVVANFSLPFCNKSHFMNFYNQINESLEKGRIFCW